MYTDGTAVFEANMFYYPHVIEAWVRDFRKMLKLTEQTLNWHYVHGYYAQLLVLGEENISLVRMALERGHTLELFAETFPIQNTL